MAITSIPGGGLQFGAAADAYSGPLKVSAINIVSTGAVDAATVIRAGGVSGTIIYKTQPPDNETTGLTFSAPLWLDDIAVSALGSNCVVQVFVA